MLPLPLPVSYLFVPGNRPERFAKAFATAAGAVILDLEDAVTPDEKSGARDAIADWLGANPVDPARLVIRINDAGSAWHADDLALIKALGIEQVMLPKAESAAQVAATVAASRAGYNLAVLPLVESARGIANVEAIASAAGVQRIAFGTLDYAVDLNLSGDPQGLLYPASRIAIASRVAGIAPPIAGVTPSLDDPLRIEGDWAIARACGFTAKMCIHPKQIDAIERLASPSDAEVRWAEKVVAAAAQSTGAVQVDGRMVDRPVVRKAEAILARRAQRPD